MYLCLYIYICNTLACYLNLYPNNMTALEFYGGGGRVFHLVVPTFPTMVHNLS